VLDAALLEAQMPVDDPAEPVAVRVPAERADALVDDHYQAVYRYAYRLSGCATTAEDLVQETFVQALRYLHQLRAVQAERGWLLAIARRQFIRWLRKSNHKEHGRMVSLDCPSLDIDAALGEPHTLTAPQLAIEQRDCVEHALAELGCAARMIIVMHYFEELSYSEIANQLNIPIGTVMSRLSRSRDQLRKLLGDDAQAGQSAKAALRDSLPSPIAPSHLDRQLSPEARHG
jgi:RNA polymerase sigma-70 factor (ECF subfamily)